MGLALYLVRTPDGVEIGPCAAATIKVYISEGIITAESHLVTGSGLLPVTAEPEFAAALGVEDAADPQLDGVAVNSMDILYEELEEQLEASPPQGAKSRPEEIRAVATVGAEIEIGFSAGAYGKRLGLDVEAEAVTPRDTRPTISIDLPGKDELARDATGALPTTISGRVEDILGSEAQIIDPWFAGLISSLWRNRETGVVQVAAGGVDTWIYLAEGAPVWATSNALNDSLGRLLVRYGKITEEQLESIVDLMSAQPEQRLGEIAVEMGVATEQDIQDALRLQARERVLACFQWTDLHITLQRTRDFLERIPKFRLHVPRLVLDGVREYYGPERLALVLDSVERLFPLLTVPTGDLTEQLGLSPEERSMLGTLSGQQMFSRVRQASAMDPVKTGQFLAALILSGALEIRRGPTRETVTQKPRDVVVAQHRRPGKQHPSPSQDEQSTTPKLGRARRFRAEAAFKKGSRLLGKNVAEAKSKFEKAVSLNPHALEYRLHLSFADYRLAKTEEDRRKLGEQTRSLAGQTLEQDARSGAAHAILGHFAKMDGRWLEALQAFKQAVELNPHDHEARREFRLIRTRLLTERKEREKAKADPEAASFPREPTDTKEAIGSSGREAAPVTLAGQGASPPPAVPPKASGQGGPRTELNDQPLSGDLDLPSDDLVFDSGDLS